MYVSTSSTKWYHHPSGLKNINISSIQASACSPLVQGSLQSTYAWRMAVQGLMFCGMTEFVICGVCGSITHASSHKHKIQRAPPSVFLSTKLHQSASNQWYNQWYASKIYHLRRENTIHHLHQAMHSLSLKYTKQEANMPMIDKVPVSSWTIPAIDLVWVYSSLGEMCLVSFCLAWFLHVIW